jgi:AhpD family alkylhydroperoxidase
MEPGARAALLGVTRYVKQSGLDSKLIHLINVRTSQINGCAFCINMHAREAREEGETEQRLYGLSAWRETPFYTPQERAALALAEAVTRIDHGVPDDVYAEAEQQFSHEEILRIIMATIAMNGWNRIAISTRMSPPTSE